MISISRIWKRVRCSAAELIDDRRGVAALEFVFIVPLMLVMFFGTVEFSSGVSIYRKVTLIARTLSDLTTQSQQVDDTDLTSFFYASYAILQPFASAPNFPTTTATISELYVDPLTLQVRVQWSRSAIMTSASSSSVVVLGTGRAVSSIVTIPTQLVVPGAYMIFSEISQLYKPAIGYVMSPAGVTMSDVSYTRPRQSTCVFYAAGSTEPGTSGICPTH